MTLNVSDGVVTTFSLGVVQGYRVCERNAEGPSSLEVHDNSQVRDE